MAIKIHLLERNIDVNERGNEWSPDYINMGWERAGARGREETTGWWPRPRLAPRASPFHCTS